MDQYLITSRGKTHKKQFGGPKLGSLVFLEIVYDDSLEHFPINSKGKTKKKISGTSNWGQDDLFYSNVVKHPHKLACFTHF